MIKESPIFNELRTSLITSWLKIMERPNEAPDSISAQVTWFLSDKNDSFIFCGGNN